MKMKHVMLAILAASALVLVTEARAATISGSLWTGIGDSTPADPAHLPGGPANVTFSVPNGTLAFDSRSGGNNSAFYTISTWLNTGGASINTGSGAGSMDDTFIYMTGQVTVGAGQVFNVTHDDGLTLVINGVTVINQPNATAPVLSTGTWGGSAGTYTFQLYYDEVQGAPAVLDIALPFQGTVPDGGTTVGLLGMALAGLAGLGRRLRAS